MSAVNFAECCICMDDICQDTNRVTTECGHIFHTSCLMKSVAHNGFGCPYCRTKMAEDVTDEEDEEYEDYDDEEELYDDNALTSLRMFHQRLSGEQVEDEPIEEDLNEGQEQEQEEDPLPPVPTPAFVARKLTQQGVTIEQIVKCLLLNHAEYDEEEFDEDLNRMDGVIFGKLRVIISNYRPEQEENICDCDGLCRMCRN